MEGFQDLQIEDGEEPGTQKVTVITDGSAEVSAYAAVQSLGDKGSTYVLQTWQKKEDSES
ncbi:MAG: hypothetical protein WD342_09400 [Verrucomicrobiales bacterium]